MSGTAVIETTPISIAEMVAKIREDRMANSKKRLKALAEDEKSTRPVILQRFGLRKGKHRAEPIEAALYIPVVPNPKHIEPPFVRPTSLFELVNN